MHSLILIQVRRNRADCIVLDIFIFHLCNSLVILLLVDLLSNNYKCSVTIIQDANGVFVTL